MLSIDTADLCGGWREEPQLPGPPRWCHSVTAVGGKLYVIGGAVTSPAQATYTAVDNWVFDPSAAAWRRLPDLPVASGNFQTNGGSLNDRYILLVGGYPYGHVWTVNGSVAPGYGQAHKLCTASGGSDASCRTSCPASRSGMQGTQEYNNNSWVFDTVELTFGAVASTATTDPSLLPSGCGGFPMNDNLPQSESHSPRPAVAPKMISATGAPDDTPLTAYSSQPTCMAARSLLREESATSAPSAARSTATTRGLRSWAQSAYMRRSERGLASLPSIMRLVKHASRSNQVGILARLPERAISRCLLGLAVSRVQNCARKTILGAVCVTCNEHTIPARGTPFGRTI